MTGAGAAAAGVRVPASSANLGPGFDVLAVALDLPLTVHATPFGGRRIVATGQGAQDVPDDDGNLIWQALRMFCDAHAVTPPDVTLHCDNQIPLERGLGSSAAAAAAGVALARRLTGAPVSDQDLVDLVTRLEGHADNAAAAVLGGLVVAGPTGPARRFDPARTLRPIVCIPGQRSSTTAARGLLPSDVPLDTAVDTARRTALVLAGLSGMIAWDPIAMADEIHEPPRLATMPGSRRLIDAARGAGLGACLSGAGPSVLVVADGDDHEASEWLATTAGDGWRVEPLRWDRSGARVVDRVATST